MKNTVNQSIMPKTAVINENGHLQVGGCDVVDLVEKYGSPLYVYDEETVRSACREYKEAFSAYPDTKILYASKAFLTQAMACIFAQEGLGLDVVSGGEIYTAYKAGFPLERAYFNGNNKSSEELELAIDTGVGRVTVDNFFELALLDSVAKSKETTVKILLRITPGIDVHTHEYIKTGTLDSKFGFDMTQLDEAIELIKEEYSNLELVGLHAHIGSQIFEIAQPYNDLIEVVSKQFALIREKHNIELTEMNVGGGLGITYTQVDNPPSMFELAEVILKAFNKCNEEYKLNSPTLIIEPGRSAICTSGVTLYTVGSAKQVPEGRKYIAVDGGMADNPRPSMYQAKYHAIVANKANETATETVTMAGRYCESGDILIRDIELPETEAGDIICVFNTGAYNYSMASNYNRVPRPAAVIVENANSDIIIERESYDNLICLDKVPQRLSCKKPEGVL
ncbi:MAG: diaminopimelate decarboxylase [bacterium]